MSFISLAQYTQTFLSSRSPTSSWNYRPTSTPHARKDSKMSPHRPFPGNCSLPPSARSAAGCEALSQKALRISILRFAATHSLCLTEFFTKLPTLLSPSLVSQSYSPACYVLSGRWIFAVWQKCHTPSLLSRFAYSAH
jgi:hypothetical protein